MKDINNEIELEYYCDEHRYLVCMPYNVDNLHRMAEDLGLKRAWFHRKRGALHYDIPIKREREIILKCNLVSSRAIRDIIRGEYQPVKS